MDKLKYIKVEQEDGTLSENIPIGVEAQNVETGSAGGSANLADYITQNNTNISNLQSADTSLQTQINTNKASIQGLASGSPKGSYANAAAIVSANPDTGVYIAQDNGHVYSWIKNGSSAIDLGVYQAAFYEESDDKALSLWNPHINWNYNETLNIYNTYLKRGYNLKDSTGEEEKSNNLIRMCTADYIPIDATKTYLWYARNCFFNTSTGVNTYIFCYDDNYNFLSKFSWNGLYWNDDVEPKLLGGTNWGGQINPWPNGTHYIKICIRTATYGNIPDEYINMTFYIADNSYGSESMVRGLYREPNKFLDYHHVDYDWDKIYILEDKINALTNVKTTNKLIGNFRNGYYPVRYKNKVTTWPTWINQRATTIELSPVEEGIAYMLVNPSGAGQGLDKSIWMYDTNKEYVTDFNLAYNTPFTIPSGVAYIRVCMQIISSTTVDLATAMSQPWGIVESGETEREKGFKISTDYIDYDFEHIPSSITEEQVKTLIKDNDKITESDIINGFKKVINHNRNNRFFNFGFFTDTHSNLQNATHSIKYMHKIANNELVDINFHGGDIISTYDPIDNVDKYVEAMLPHLNDYKSIKNLFFVKGNHDEGHVEGAENNLSKYQYNALFNPSYKDNDIKIHYNELDDYGNYYYIDLEHYKIRIIVLDSFYNPGLNSVDYGSLQIPWVATEALNDTNLTVDWSILVFSHTIGNTDNMGKVFKAYATKGTFQGYDFSNAKCKFIGTILGHEHNDNYSNAADFNRIGVTCAFGQTPAIDIFTIDTDNNILYETRIGDRGTDRAYRYGTTSEQIVTN